jgi:hypothetical protein
MVAMTKEMVRAQGDKNDIRWNAAARAVFSLLHDPDGWFEGEGVKGLAIYREDTEEVIKIIVPESYYYLISVAHVLTNRYTDSLETVQTLSQVAIAQIWQRADELGQQHRTTPAIQLNKLLAYISNEETIADLAFSTPDSELEWRLRDTEWDFTAKSLLAE